MKNYFFIILILLLFVSCGKNKSVFLQNGLPADSVIPRRQMVNMIADIHTLEAALQSVKKKGTNEQAMAVFYYRQFFSKYQMSEGRFRKNLTSYQAEADQFYQLYEDVNKELDKRISLRKMGNSKLK